MRDPTTPSSPQRTFYGSVLGFGGQMFYGTKPSTNANTIRGMARRAKVVAAIGALLRERECTVALSDYQKMHYRSTLIYCDPPYYTTGGRVRKGRNWSYACEQEFSTTVRRWLCPELRDTVLVSFTDRPLATLVEGITLKTVWQKVTPRRMETKSKGRWSQRTEYVCIASLP